MARMNMIEAIRDAIDVKLDQDDNVVVFGEDVGFFGGVFRCTDGLQGKYGRNRVFDTPINESGIVGVAVGMGAYGLRPIAEIQFADYVYPAYDQIVSEAAPSFPRSVHITDNRSHAMRRGHFWWPDTQPKPRSTVYPCLRAKDCAAVQPI
jgi:pyruvate/2-oxoglutarate/acetoin dehydrogenase E1 component